MPEPDAPLPPRQSLHRQALGVAWGVVLIAVCCLAAYLLWGLSVFLLAGGELRGRGFAAPAALAALFLASTAFAVHWSGRLRSWQVLAALFLAELGLVGLIGRVSGSYRLDRFFLSWFFGLGACLALPWLAGLAASLLLGGARRRGGGGSS